MAYCNADDVKKTGGTYLNKSVPQTMYIDWDLFISAISDEIDANLASCGAFVPVNTIVFAKAGGRLKNLCCLGVLAQVEQAISYAANPLGGEQQPRGWFYRKQFNELLKLYKENPRNTLFAGESDISTVFNDMEPVAPSGLAAWSENAGKRSRPAIPMDFRF